jgi:membrane protein required for beta-lactamase induction
VGALITGTCSLVGVQSGNGIGSVAYALLGLVIGLLLVGWVFAVARLNADVKAIRKEMEREKRATTADASP